MVSRADSGENQGTLLAQTGGQSRVTATVCLGRRYCKLGLTYCATIPPCPSPHLLSGVTWAATRKIYHLEAKGSKNGSDGAAHESQDEELKHDT